MQYWQEKIKIGALSFSRFIGGPLDGITDSPFRKLVRFYSPDALLYSEMRHVGCIANEKGPTKTLNFNQSERPLNYQVAANKVDFIAAACEKIVAAGVDLVDLNIGCPARNVIQSGSGSFLMSDPEKLQLILETFRKHLPIPFTVKIRAGFKVKNGVEIAQLIEQCGADALTIHPRLQTQMFNGIPDYQLAYQVKKSVSIPVFFSGGVVNWATAQKTYEQTGADGYLIGRGIWSKPWKLKELDEHSAGRVFTVSSDEILNCALTHFDYMLEYYGPHGLYNFRKHLPFYIKGKPTASELRGKLVRSQSIEEVKEGLRSFFHNEQTIKII